MTPTKPSRGAMLVAAALTLALAPALPAAPGSSSEAAQASAPEQAAPPRAKSVFPRAQLDRLVEKSDWIVRAEIGPEETRWAGRNIETTYQVAVRENLMGEGPETFELTLPGGRAPNGAPIRQYVRGTARVSENEEVILFLRRDIGGRLADLNAKRTAAGMEPLQYPANSKLPFSPRVVLKDKGKFNVLTLADGTKLVRRYSAAPMVLAEGVETAMAEQEVRRMGGAPAKAPVPEAAAPSAASPVPLDPTGYAASAVTNPEAAEFKSDEAAVEKYRQRMPMNADAMKRPIEMGAFRAEIARLAQNKAARRNPSSDQTSGAAAPETTSTND